MATRITAWLFSTFRLVPSWRLVLVAAAPVVLAAVTAVGVLTFTRPIPATSPVPAPPPADGNDAEGTTGLPPAAGLLVDVTGAVTHPGVYRIAKGERVSAAIAAAGGLTADADPDRLPDMAQRLKDGQQVRVLTRRSAASARGGATGVAPRATTVNLNSATAEQLAAVPGFTPEFAEAVVRYRTEYGGFASSRELVDVLNMSEADYLLARSSVRV